MARRSSASWRASATSIASGWSSHIRVLPSMSVNKNVTTDRVAITESASARSTGATETRLEPFAVAVANCLALSTSFRTKEMAQMGGFDLGLPAPVSNRRRPAITLTMGDRAVTFRNDATDASAGGKP